MSRPASPRSVREITKIALGAALLAASAWLSIPAPVPFTAQTFALFLLLGLLGMRKTLTATLVYLVLGAVGLPVFAGMQGGLAVLVGPTGGYLWGLPLAALLSGILLPVCRRLPVRLLAMAAGLLLLYAVGTLWYALLYAEAGGAWGVLGVCVLPYLLPDAVKLSLAALLSAQLSRYLR